MRQKDCVSTDRVKIYVMIHKPFEVPGDPMYIPVQVGRKEAKSLLGYTGDDSGDNISDQNCYFSELTGLYWVWKNVTDTEYVGTCHYRRYLLNEKGYMFTGAEIVELLSKYDVITTKNLQLNFSYYEGFSFHHKIRYLDETGQVIREQCPMYYETFQKLVHEKHTYFGNMLICRKELYDAYCAWLFDILFEVQRRVPVEEEDSYHRRIFGFISEFLQYVWICHNHLRVKECMVGMLGEKAEVTEVKRQLADFFAAGDCDGAKAFFLEARRKRPDLLMEASDITGELHLCMEVIAIAGLEQEAYGHSILDKIRDYRELMLYCNKLNRYALQQSGCGITGGKSEALFGSACKDNRQIEPELEQWKEATGVTPVALNVACNMLKI